MKANNLKRGALLAALLGLPGAAHASLEDWNIKITVDNQYHIYFGTNTTTTANIGGDSNWFTMETYSVTGRAPTDYLYVSTASDQSVAQGFLGSFENVTRGVTILTGAPDWEVFRAGDHLMALFGMSGTWPFNVMPTQAQVDTAIAYATANNLWTPAASHPGYTNPGLGPWFAFPAIPSNAQWIWAPSSTGGNPLQPGGDHGEFLVFRIAGIPSPGAGALLALGGLVALRRRRN